MRLAAGAVGSADDAQRAVNKRQGLPETDRTTKAGRSRLLKP